MRGKTVALVLACFAFATFPVGAASIQRAVSGMVDKMAMELINDKPLVSKIGIGVLPITDESPLARKHEIGATVRALVEKAIGDSLVFKLIDRNILDSSLKEIELALSDLSGSTKLKAQVIEEIDYFIEGSVTEEADQFHVTLKLIKTDTTATISVVESAFPITDLVTYGDEVFFRPFGFIGPYATVEWAMAAGSRTQFGSIVPSAGLSALFPLRTVYARAGVNALYAQASQSSFNYNGWPAPASASGTSKVVAVCGMCGLGVFVPISIAVYGHLGLDLGLGADWRRELMQDTSGHTYFETNFEKTELYFLFSLNAGAAIKLTDSLVLDAQLGIEGRTFDLLGMWTEGGMFMPLSISLAYPFRK
jgi:hypothetical protein